MVGENQSITGSTLGIADTPWSLPSFVSELVASNLENSSFRKSERRYSSGSDHFIFDDSTVRIPFTSLTQWPDRFYHTSEDTVDKSSIGSFEWIGSSVLNTILDLTFGVPESIAKKTKARIVSKYIRKSSRNDFSRNWLAYKTYKSLEAFSKYADVSDELKFIEGYIDFSKITEPVKVKNFRAPLGDNWMNEDDKEWEYITRKNQSF